MDIITETAVLECTEGTATSILSVTSQNFSRAENKLIATEQDKEAYTNIKPFRKCRLKPTSSDYLPCTPAPTSWQKTTEKDTVNGYRILLENSVCPCSTGGTIRIKSKGHEGEHKG